MTLPRKTRSVFVLSAVIAVLVVAGGAAFAVTSSKQVSVCVTSKNVVRSAASNGKCPARTSPVSINQSGQPGAAGAAGAKGDAGSDAQIPRITDSSGTNVGPFLGRNAGNQAETLISGQLWSINLGNGALSGDVGLDRLLYSSEGCTGDTFMETDAAAVNAIVTFPAPNMFDPMFQMYFQPSPQPTSPTIVSYKSRSDQQCHSDVTWNNFQLRRLSSVTPPHFSGPLTVR